MPSTWRRALEVAPDIRDRSELRSGGSSAADRERRPRAELVGRAALRRRGVRPHGAHRASRRG